jgi:hypothetical protein
VADRVSVPAGEKKVRSWQNLAVAAVDPDHRKSGRSRTRRPAPDANAQLMRRRAAGVRRHVVRAHDDVDADAQTGIQPGFARDVYRQPQRSARRRITWRGRRLCAAAAPVEANEAGVLTVQTDGSCCTPDGSDARGVLRVARKFRSCICRRYSALSVGDVAASIARTTMTRATNFQGGSMAARKKAAKRGAKKSAKRGKKAAKRGKKK